MSNKHKYIFASVFCSVLVGCFSTGDSVKPDLTMNKNNINIWPTLKVEVKPRAKVERQVDEIMKKMTLAQKVAQMIQPEIREFTEEDMRKYGFGSYLNGGGSFPNGNKHAKVQDWVDLAEKMYQASIDDSIDGSVIPTMWGTDAVHGHNNVLGATLFPHNIGLGAANNPKLIENIAKVTATEVLVTGIDWIFAPTVATVRDDRWGRTYESYSEDPAIVRDYSAAIVRGLQGTYGKEFLTDQQVISTVKHFVGDGGTVDGVDQGNNIANEQDLFDIHGQGYVGGLTAGAQSVMASFNSWHGDKLHGQKYLLTEVLKQKMGFDGFVVGDWNGHGQVEGCTNESCAKAINAGLDIVMVPGDWQALYYNTIKQVETGEIAQSRINDAVRRILRVKIRAGLFEKPSPAQRPLAGKTELIGAKPHRDLARQAVRESLVLLKNNQQVLPISPKSKVFITGDAADNIGKQSGGWSITWQGTNNTNDDFPGGTSIYQALARKISQAGGSVALNAAGNYTRKPDVAIVVFGEEPYAEGDGDVDDLEYQKAEKSDLALLKRLKADGIPVVSVFISGRPMWVNAELNASDAFVAAWLPGTEATGIADILLKQANGEVNYDFTGKLSFSWPNQPKQLVNFGDSNYQPLFPYGYGLTYKDKQEIPNDLEEGYDKHQTLTKVVNIHKNSLRKPWQMSLISGDETLSVSSSTHTLSDLTYRTMDKLIQEDSFRIASEGKDESATKAVRFVHPKVNAVDLLASKNSLYLTLDYLVNQTPERDLRVSIECLNEDNQDCVKHYSLNTKMLLTDKKWQPLALDVSCIYVASNESFLALNIESKGGFDVSLANIQLTSEKPATEVLHCDN